jgi:lipopolysaccharide transport system ATP-binding protein
MNDVVICCEGLGKSYSIGHQGPQERYTALRDVLARQARGVWNATRRALRGQMAVAGDQVEEFWALKDVSFEIKRGEVVGIIGRNGAGKSTLLKILSRITEPTEGRVKLRGRVASLLEVGTGFHPELTGRENVFLNGAILGMTRSEIKRKFDEIVAFAEIEKFLDTPVKRYSSGMYVRLAFAVAAHLEPEILIVDEVLAVGDAAFQKKCLGKMQDVSRGGRTVLFVSHNLAAVQALCSRGIILSSGQLCADGWAREVIDIYHQTMSNTNGRLQKVWLRTESARPIQLTGMRILSKGLESTAIPVGSEVTFRISYGAKGPQYGCSLRLKILNSLEQVIVKFSTDMSTDYSGVLADCGEIECAVPALNLMPGNYTISLALKQGNDRVDYVTDAAHFQIVPAAITANGKLPDEGVCIIPCKWRQFDTEQTVRIA